MILLAVTGPGAFLIVAIFVILLIIPEIYYLATLQSTLKMVSPENRRMDPVQVWLSLIPLFGIVWQYFVVARMADSLAAEFSDRRIPSDERRPGFSLGFAYCLLYSCVFIPVIGVLCLLGGLVCWILYWLKITEYQELLRKNPPAYINI